MAGYACPIRRMALVALSIPCAFSAVPLGGAMDGRRGEPKEIIMRLHANWGPAPAQQLKRVLADSVGGNLHLANCENGVAEQCDYRRSFDTAPQVPSKGPPTVSMFNEKFASRSVVFCIACHGCFLQVFPS